MNLFTSHLQIYISVNWFYTKNYYPSYETWSNRILITKHHSNEIETAIKILCGRLLLHSNQYNSAANSNREKEFFPLQIYIYLFFSHFLAEIPFFFFSRSEMCVFWIFMLVRSLTLVITYIPLKQHPKKKLKTKFKREYKVEQQSTVSNVNQ